VIQDPLVFSHVFQKNLNASLNILLFRSIGENEFRYLVYREAAQILFGMFGPQIRIRHGLSCTCSEAVKYIRVEFGEEGSPRVDVTPLIQFLYADVPIYNLEPVDIRDDPEDPSPFARKVDLE
jgi:hypothetical protein